MKLRQKLILFIFTILPLSALSAAPGISNREAITDSLRIKLAKATTLKDSIPLLYDLFDLSPIDDRVRRGEILLDALMRGGTRQQQIEQMCSLGSVFGGGHVNKKRFGELINAIAAMPQSVEQHVALCLLRAELMVAQADTMSEASRQRHVRELIINNTTVDNPDPYDRIEFLLKICTLLKADISSERLASYLSELRKLLYSTPHITHDLKSFYHLEASLIYNVSDQREKTVECCLEYLKLLDERVTNAKDVGRKYRSFETYYTITYSRLLNCYKLLPEDDVDLYYNNILEICRRNPDAARLAESTQRCHIFYMMDKGRYNEALELLNKQIDNPANEAYRAIFYAYMIEAAGKTNNTEMLLKGYKGAYDLFTKINAERIAERTNDIDILAQVRNMRDVNMSLQLEQNRKDADYHRQMFIIAIIGASTLLLIIIVLLLLFRRSNRLSAKIRESNKQLTGERDTLRNIQKELIEARDHARRADRHKTEFINNMSHEVRTPLNALVECAHIITDNIDDKKRVYLQRYADMIDVSADMLRAIINDVLDIASIENSTIEVQRRSASVNDICNVAVASMRKHAAEGVEMSYLNTSDPDINILTDSRRVEQVLCNLLNNGAKFTEEGYVHLSYRLNPATSTEAATISFIVEDTGIGVPEGKEEIIFERFTKLSNLYPGTGLGLNISRMIAEMLHGTVKVDTTYAGPGARFIFTIPA